MNFTVIRIQARFAFWSWALFLTALAWRLLADLFGLAPPAVGGIAALSATAGAASGLIGCLPGNNFRGFALLGLVSNALAAAYFAPWILWGL